MCRRQGVSRVRIGGDRRRLGLVTRAKLASGWATGGGRLGLSWPEEERGRVTRPELARALRADGGSSSAAPPHPPHLLQTASRAGQPSVALPLGESAASFSRWLERGHGMPSRSCRDCRWGWAAFHGVGLSWRTASFAPCLGCAAAPLRRVSTAPRLAGARTRARRPDPTSRYPSLFRPGSKQGRDELIPAGSRALTVFCGVYNVGPLHQAYMDSSMRVALMSQLTVPRVDRTLTVVSAP